MELFIGRLHPLIVHFPIGLLTLALVMEFLTIGNRRPGLRPGVNWMIAVGAASAVIAATLGFFLSTYDDYTGNLVQSHQNWGLITAVGASCSAFLLYLKLSGQLSTYRPYRACLFLTVVSLVVTSHLGASLTHGEDYLSAALPGNHEAIDHQGSKELLTSLSQSESYSEHDLDLLNLEVRAIFARNCYQCHSENKKKGELVLEHKRGVYQGGESGAIIVSGSAANSELFRRVSLPSHHKEVMPKKGKTLKQHQISLIKLWIDQGAHWADRALEVFPEAPLALQKPALPSGGNSHPVDRWTDAYFNQHGITWPEVVDDRTFIRRAYLDLIGLLPEPGQVQKFCDDQRQDKRSILIDQLLNDTHNYTQHWLSFWNDLLRNDYSGTGFITGGRKQITDWLYQSLLDNKPYNMMVEQLVNPNEASEGFIKGIQWRGVVNASQSTEMQAAQNISQSLMGMNLKCASCHNSFVSNLTLEQAYNFASVFADSALELTRCEQPLGTLAKPEFIYSELGTIEADCVRQRLLKLSEIITKPENGRLYRTITNRIWKKLLGRGLIEPVDQMDNTPWNAELLDWLTADFMESGYDLKLLIRRVMTSRSYQLPAIKYQHQDEAYSNAYVFRGPMVRRLTAEQFVDAVSQIAAPMYYATAYQPEALEFPIGRIWHREVKFDRDVLPEPGERYFRYIFDLENQQVKQATMLISVDHSYELLLNGKLISQGSDWRKVDKIEAGQHFRSGRNVIAIRGNNEGTIANPAGILMAAKVITTDGDTLMISSNEQWKSSADAPEGDWTSLEYDHSHWIDVRNYGSRYWDGLVAMSFEDDKPEFARASLVRQHPFMKALGRPTRENVTTTRADQATLLQALELTNGSYFNSVLTEGASRWLAAYGSDSNRISRELYQKAFGRTPSRQEIKIISGNLGEQPDQAAVQDLLWATLLSPEFQFIY